MATEETKVCRACGTDFLALDPTGLCLWCNAARVDLMRYTGRVVGRLGEGRVFMSEAAVSLARGSLATSATAGGMTLPDGWTEAAARNLIAVLASAGLLVKS